MLAGKIPTFEELILEAKEAGHGWHRDNFSKAVKCANGRCVLGAIIAKRRIPEPKEQTDNYGEAIDGTWSLEGSMDFPTEGDAEALLGIPEELASRVITANDGVGRSREDMELLDKLLGISGS